MTIQWDRSQLESFFAVEISVADNEGELGRICSIDFVGSRLKYSIHLLIDLEIVSVSGDDLHPFGADSLYEIQVPCDFIEQCADRYYPGEIGLAFWYGDRTMKHNQTLSILKRLDGDLKVWPSIPYPIGHRFHVKRND